MSLLSKTSSSSRSPLLLPRLPPRHTAIVHCWGKLPVPQTLKREAGHCHCPSAMLWPCAGEELHEDGGWPCPPWKKLWFFLYINFFCNFLSWEIFFWHPKRIFPPLPGPNLPALQENNLGFVPGRVWHYSYPIPFSIFSLLIRWTIIWPLCGTAVGIAEENCWCPRFLLDLKVDGRSSVPNDVKLVTYPLLRVSQWRQTSLGPTRVGHSSSRRQSLHSIYSVRWNLSRRWQI